MGCGLTKKTSDVDDIALRNDDKILLTGVTNPFRDPPPPILKIDSQKCPPRRKSVCFEVDMKNKTYPSGDIYRGKLENDKRNGYGTMKYANQDIYEGFWQHDLFHGSGVMKWADGSCYDGEFCYGQRDGQGKYSNSDFTFIYNGEWMTDFKHGKGTLIKKRIEDEKMVTTTYTGTWMMDNFTGKGTSSEVREQEDNFPKIVSSYEGDWVNGRRHGVGYYEENSPEGLVSYKGEWRNDAREGRGLQTWPSGVAYNGIWLNDKPLENCHINLQDSNNISSEGSSPLSILGQYQRDLKMPPNSTDEDPQTQAKEPIISSL